MALIDFHSHILPGIDDGSANVEQSFAMLRMMEQQGIKQVVATPHFYPQHDSPERFVQRRERAYQQLCDQVLIRESFPAVILGAEVYFFRGMSQSDQLERLTIGEKRCILIEMPMAAWTDEMYRELEQIRTQRGIVPIVAHIDRYLRPFTAGARMRRLEQSPVVVQANADFFLKRTTARTALRLLKENRIHLLGSDCHDTERRKPNLDAALQRVRTKLGDDVIRRIEMHQEELLDLK